MPSSPTFHLVGFFNKKRKGAMSAGSKEEILAAAKRAAMAHGYNGLNFRDIAGEVGIKAPSIYHHFPTKADLGAAVAKRYWEDIVVDLEAISDQSPDPLRALRRYPEIFRKSLAMDNRMCLCSFMAAEYDDLPETVKKEVQTFADVNVAWLSKLLSAAAVVNSGRANSGRALSSPPSPALSSWRGAALIFRCLTR